ncbi:hypothetical protein WMY93_019426 [Mugilogobius chulae]|uniref:Uncharacterized protein n=1 Tax=Mugilogobius chulae TaxID=88201 RepID=A0AAW0NFA2_9GOBI
MSVSAQRKYLQKASGVCSSLHLYMTMCLSGAGPISSWSSSKNHWKSSVLLHNSPFGSEKNSSREHVFVLIWFFFSSKESPKKKSRMDLVHEEHSTSVTSSVEKLLHLCEIRLKHQLSILSRTAIFVPHISLCLVIVPVSICTSLAPPHWNKKFTTSPDQRTSVSPSDLSQSSSSLLQHLFPN